MNSDVNDRRGRGFFFSTVSILDILPGALPHWVDVRQTGSTPGITIGVSRPKLLAEEGSHAYKDVTDVVRACERAGLSQIVVRLRPVGVVKG